MGTFCTIMITERLLVKLLIINNLASGFGEGAVYDFMRSFITDSDEICLRSTDGTSDLRGFLHDASDFDAVVASGGDGTVAAVCYELRNTRIPVLPFPAGTANLLAQNLANPYEPHALSKLIRTGKTLDFDLGEVEVAGELHGFAVMAGAGFDAKIMHGAKTTKKILGSMAYLSAAFANAIPPMAKFKMVLDGEEFESEGLGIILVNFSKIQFDISVTHDSHPRDGLLDVVVLKAATALELIPAVFAGLLDTITDFPGRSGAIEIHRARNIEISADPPMEMQFDGEASKLTTPFKARALPKSAQIYISDEGYEQYTDRP